jgi:hypothetical protein
VQEQTEVPISAFSFLLNVYTDLFMEVYYVYTPILLMGDEHFLLLIQLGNGSGFDILFEKVPEP